MKISGYFVFCCLQIRMILSKNSISMVSAMFAKETAIRPDSGENGIAAVSAYRGSLGRAAIGGYFRRRNRRGNRA